jgi:hypothetical protein
LYILRTTVVDGLRREQPDAGVVMLNIIPREKDLAETPAILDAAEPIREVRSVLERLELRLEKGVVIARIRPAVGLSDAQIA